MNTVSRIGVIRPLVYFLIVAFVMATVPTVRAESYSATGPYGNTITVTEDSVYGEFEGVEYSADDDSVTLNGHDVEDDNGGGGGGGNGAAIAIGLVVVAVAVGAGIWWYYSKKSKTADNLEIRENLVEHRINDTASIKVTPKMLEVAGLAPEDVPDLNVEDLASAEVGFCLKF